MRPTTLAARSPPAAPTPATPVILPSAQFPASRRVATTSAAGETGTSVVDLVEIPSRPVPSLSEQGPRRARAPPRATTMPPS